MSYIFYLAYGEGQISSTASGVFLGLVVFVVGCLAFGVYSYRTYPVDKE